MMEATEKTVSEEDEPIKTDHLTEHQRKVFEALRQMNVHGYCPPAAQVAGRAELDSVTTKAVLVELCKLGIVIWRIDASGNDTYRLSRPDEFIRMERRIAKNGGPVDAKIPRTHEAVAAAALKSKVKQLYEDGFTYDEISEQLNIPRGTVSTNIYRLVAKGEMKARGKGKRRKADEGSVSPNQHPSSTGTVSPKVQSAVQPKIYSCPKCDFVTKSYAGMQIHTGQKHQTTTEMRNKYKLQELKEDAKAKKKASEQLVTITLTMGEALETGIALALADKIDEKRFEDSHKISEKVLQALVDQIARENHVGAS